ncbi:MAG: hypothetical protein AB7J40_00100 [Candidatus Altimarinota bacterium]
MSSDKRKSGKFITPILIGGALGSVVAWAFGSRKRRETISEKIEGLIHQEPPKKKGFLSRLFGRKD